MSNIDQQLEKFKKAMIKINNYQSLTNSLVKKMSVYQQELEKNNIIKKRSEMTDSDWSSHINFIFKDYSTGEFSSLGASKFTIDDSERIELELKNRQYQFLLLDAFEAFEKYLKNAELLISNKSENNKNFSPTKFIVNLHKCIPIISRIIKIRNEANEKFLEETFLFLTFSAIEQLRHQIAHTSGYAEDKSIFIKKCLERIGRYNSSKPKSEYADYLNSFFGRNQYENLICLIEIRDKENPFYYYDRLGDLLTELASYIVFIHAHIKYLINEVKSTSAVATSVNPLDAPSA